ncbi:putative F-box protein At5g55150 isoform X1 [Apium graveolens]|uniref:putative F-box protein At5g55150 isoform X1 n=1 Tax=Apium graveolens TaxID=4045 RepID=UPI003D7A0723
MAYSVNWTELPKDLVVSVAHRLSFLEEFFQFTAVCKSWKSATEAHKPLCLPMRYPLLLLAEEVAPGAIRFDGVYDQDYSDTDTDEDKDEDEDVGEKEDFDTIFLRWKASYDYLKNSIGSSRGLYSLLSMKTYNIELPEAAGRLILGTNKGWLVTLGRDLQINLLHPLLRHQVSLPPMLTFPRQYRYHEGYTPEEATDQFIQKVAMSSRLLTCNTDVSLCQHRSTPSPIVMAVYGASGFLGFARLGDKVWTDVNVPSRSFHDIIYHDGSFYAVDHRGDVYVCCIDNDKERGPRGTKIASLECDSLDQKYLVEPLSGSGLLLVVRYNKIKQIEHNIGIEVKYGTTDFVVWRLDLKYSDSVETPSCTLTEVNNLGNEAIFVGRASSLSVSSSEIVRPNSIYFTDDNSEAYYRIGGGHDMGIFDIERGTIEPHFHGNSIHPISPPLWYI